MSSAEKLSYEDALSLMRPYQLDGIRKIQSVKRGWIFDEVGLGKTPQTILALRGQLPNPSCAILVVCPSYAMNVWIEEFEKWWPGSATFTYTGTLAQREKTYTAFRYLVETDTLPRAKVLICTYNMIEEVRHKKPAWWAAVYDECHALSNPKTKRHNAARNLSSHFLVFLTGTPFRKNVGELWSYLNLIDGMRYQSYWPFVKKHCHVYDNGFGKEIIGPKNSKGMRDLIFKYGVRRLKADVRKDMPSMTRQLILVDMPDNLRRFYDQFDREMFAECAPGDYLFAPNSLAKNVKLRQVSCCPSMLGLNELAPVWAPALELAEDVIAQGDSVVMFTPFREAAEQTKQFLRQRMSDGFPIEMIHGGQTKVMNDMALRKFKEAKGPAILIATVGMAASWSATKANVGIFLSYSYSPIDCYQCEGRLHRHGQQKPVFIYYMGCKNTIDKHIVNVLDQKVTWSKAVLKGRNYNVFGDEYE